MPRFVITDTRANIFQLDADGEDDAKRIYEAGLNYGAHAVGMTLIHHAFDLHIERMEDASDGTEVGSQSGLSDTKASASG